ncbi:hypothetical protein D3C86_1574170 [compost metagenome]
MVDVARLGQGETVEAGLPARLEGRAVLLPGLPVQDAPVLAHFDQAIETHHEGDALELEVERSFRPAVGGGLGVSGAREHGPELLEARERRLFRFEHRGHVEAERVLLDHAVEDLAGADALGSFRVQVSRLGTWPVAAHPVAQGEAALAGVPVLEARAADAGQLQCRGHAPKPSVKALRCQGAMRSGLKP